MGLLLRVLEGTSGVNGRFSSPKGLAFTAYDMLLICDSQNNRVQEINIADGTLVKMWGEKGDKRGELERPCVLAIGADGEVYVGDYSTGRIQVFV